MIDDFLELLINSGVTTKSGQEFNEDGHSFVKALYTVMSRNLATPKAIAEIMAQYLTLPAATTDDLIEAPAQPVATVHINLNVDMTTMPDYKLDRLANMVKSLNSRMAEDSDSE